MKKGLVSVIIPTYSRPNNIIRAIESVRVQNYENVEIIVVDDNGIGTTNQIETAKLLKPYIDTKVVKYVTHEKNRNGSAARNTGFKVSDGEFINFFDDDDEMGPDKLLNQVLYLSEHGDKDGCFCDTIEMRGTNAMEIKNPEEANWLEGILLREIFFNTSTVLFRRGAIEDIGGFDESFYRHQDWELYVRFLRKHKFGKAKCKPLIKHTSPNIISQNPQKSVGFMEKFLNTFHTELMSQPRGKLIFKYQYEKLAELLLATCYYSKAFQCIIKSLKYGLPSLKQTFRYAYFIVRPLRYGAKIN